MGPEARTRRNDVYLLTVTRGPDKGRKILLQERKKYTIGASPDDSIALTDPKVLDGHCSIVVQQGKPILENHTASAGTFVGDRKINRAGLKPGAVVRVGDTLLTLTLAPKGAGEAPAAASKDVEPDPLIGKIIGGYKLNEVVGVGGMGTVYKATQLSLHRDVALKVLRPRLAKDPSFVDLFVAEARHAAQIVDPNVVQVYDAGTEGDICYFAMEFIGQGSVQELIDRDNKVAWEEAILMIIEAAHGLQYAEGKGIVHRDIKPDNLMINDDGHIKIADLGLAKRGEGQKDQGIIGTPHFIPPEQALGKEVDTRADIYSLGATFFRMITGKTVFSGKTAKEIVLKHIKEPPPAASSIDSSIPDELEAVIATMLAKDPNGRYQNTQELISALETICANYGIKGSIIKTGIPKRVLIPVVVLAIAAVGVSIYFATREKEVIFDAAAVKRAAELEEQQKKDRAELADQHRAIRMGNSKSALQALQLVAADLPAIEDTFDEQKTAPRRKAAWIKMAKDYREFAESKLAREFSNDIIAKKAADRIEKDLKSLELVKDNKRDWIDAQLKNAEEIDAKQRKLLSKLRTDGHYGDAVNLCKKLGRDKPSRTDPFRKIETAVWENPLNKTVKSPAKLNKKIMDVIAAARENMKKERPIVLEEAQAKWDTVKKSAQALTKQAPDAEVRSVIDQATGIENRFAAQSGGTPKAISTIVRAAKDIRLTWSEHLIVRQAKRLQSDLLYVRNTLRSQRSRDPGAIPNLVMECDIATAIDRWQQLLQGDQIQTVRYKRFAQERIEMLRWVDYLFWRFHADTKETLGDRQKGPMRTLHVDLPKSGARGKIVQDRFAKPPDNIYKFAVTRRFKGATKFGTLPMDWVYQACFHHRGAARWKDVTPVLEFALGVFCMETMQYDLAVEHFRKLAQNGVAGGERYAASAKVLLAQAEAEKADLAAYLSIVAVLQRKGVNAQDVREALRQLGTFHTRHEGTLFYLDVMRRADPIRKDVDGRPVPDLPAAPPH